MMKTTEKALYENACQESKKAYRELRSMRKHIEDNYIDTSMPFDKQEQLAMLTGHNDFWNGYKIALINLGAAK